MQIKVFCRSALIFAIFAASIFVARAQDELTPYDSTLTSRYANQIQSANSIREAGIYYLAFSAESADSAEKYIGNLMLAWQMQRTVIAKTQKSNARMTKPKSVPFNGPFVSMGMSIVGRNLEKACPDCKTDEQRAVWTAAANDYFREIFDIHGAKGGYSGLPFYSAAVERFRDPIFQKRAIALQTSLLRLGKTLAGPTPTPANTTVWNLALEACGNDPRAAIELLGLTLSRDTSGLNYFKRTPAKNPEFIAAVGEIPLVVRIIAELDRVARRSSVDRFSYEGTYSTANVKNYYFWSSAYAAERMYEKGYSEETVQKLATEFPRQYKNARAISRKLVIKAGIPAATVFAGYAGIKSGIPPLPIFLADAGFGAVAFTTNHDAAFFKRDAIEVMRKSRQGAIFAYKNCHAALEAAKNSKK